MDIAGHHRVDESAICTKEANGWPDEVYAPSAIPFSDNYPMPKEMTLKNIEYVKAKFVECVERCKQIGCELDQRPCRPMSGHRC